MFDSFYTKFFERYFFELLSFLFYLKKGGVESLVGTEVKRSLSMSMVLGSMPLRVVKLMC